MIAVRGARAGARYAGLIAAPLLGTACGSPQHGTADATIVRAAAQAQASVAAYERATVRRGGQSSPRSSCAVAARAVSFRPVFRPVALTEVPVTSRWTERRALVAVSTAEPCAG
ncbi:hypothetical protein KZ813_09790 [Sphingomonas sp. RHCKR7]|uniref:hypothetical protein n=1 Tax=Sphingomonas folli TaxID=2862497 RepID=UPI001CA55823|nr:hypothetical protein [Sphingomonas folli]MBW6527129.1 hypothetical protein [Sphingomonas folli]